MEIVESKLEGNLLQEFTADYIEEHKDLINFVKKETEKRCRKKVVIDPKKVIKTHPVMIKEWWGRLFG